MANQTMVPTSEKEQRLYVNQIPRRVYVVDDDEAVRGSLERMIRSMDLDVVCFDSAESFKANVDDSRPACLILDIRMPGISGLELQDQLLSADFDIPVIIITGHGDVAMSVMAMKRGAIDFLEKPYRPAQLRASIRTALELSEQRFENRKRRKHVRRLLSQLSEEETAILKRIVDGMTNKEIADEFDVSLRTIQFRRSAIMQKLGVETKVELIQLGRYIES